MKPPLRVLVAFGAIVLAWELFARAGWLNPIIIASPTAIVLAAGRDLPIFLDAFRLTLFEMTAAILIAWVGGVMLGVLGGSVRWLGRATVSLFTAVMAVPLVVLYPLLVAWVGIGPQSKIVYGALAGIAPIAISTTIGLRSVDRRYRTMALAIGASAWQTRFLVLVPLAIPTIVAGLRIGTSLTIIGVIVSEMLAAADGIGYLISYHRSLLNTGHVYLGIAFALAVAWIVNLTLSQLQRRLERWRAIESASTK